MIVITYATHRTEVFDKIVNNDYGVNVKVLGMGSKWNGFMDKLKGVRDFCKTLAKDEIVVFIDGFDSVINKYNSQEIEKLFKKHNCKILFSRDPVEPNIVNRYTSRKMFGECRNNEIANSGMYMGYAGYLSLFLNEILTNCKSNDDQKCINKMCNNYIAIDSNREIFHNIAFSTSLNKSSSAYFVSYPGSLTIDRISRIPKEYIHPFLIEFIILILALYFINHKISLYFNILFILVIAYSYIFS